MPGTSGPPSEPRRPRFSGRVLALLAASGLAGCAASGPASLPEAGIATAEAIVGEWASVDTLRWTFRIPDGEGDDAGKVFEQQTLRAHLSISDSTWTETSVSWNPNGLTGQGFEGVETTLPYRIEGDSVFTLYGAGRPEAATLATVRGDTLTITFTSPDGETFAPRFVRSEPLGVPSLLIGLWVGLSEPDAAGVPAEFGFRFAADGTYESGWGDPMGAFRVVGPYLMLEDKTWGEAISNETGLFDGGAMRPPFRMTFEMELGTERVIEPGVTTGITALVLRLGDGREGSERIVLYRR